MIRKLKPGEAITKQRKTQVTRFELTEEWRVLKKVLDKGLQHGEGYVVILTAEEMQRYRIKTHRSVARTIRLYIAAHKLPYTVSYFSRVEGHTFVVKSYLKQSA